jgi:hypothetical protein
MYPLNKMLLIMEVTFISISENLKFQGVYVGATARLPVTIVNLSMIPAVVVMNLSQHPEFFLAPGNCCE